MRRVARDRLGHGLGLEALESRCLMAGNVSLGLQAGLLVLSGDALANHVQVSEPAPGRIRVDGLDGTTVNGQGSAEVTGTVSGAALRFEQGGQDQVVIVGPVNVPGKLRIALADGDLTIEGSAGRVRVGSDLVVRGGDNVNVTLVNNVSVRGRTDIAVGGSVTVASGKAAVPDFAAAQFNNSLNIDNPYFPAVPGTIWTYHADGIDPDTGQPFTQRTVVEVMPDTRTILGIPVRIIHDRVFQGTGAAERLIEDTFDWYAQDDNGNVWYFGEDVTDFEYDANGNLIATTHPGIWEAGTGG